MSKVLTKITITIEPSIMGPYAKLTTEWGSYNCTEGVDLTSDSAPYREEDGSAPPLVIDAVKAALRALCGFPAPPSPEPTEL